MDVMVLMQVLNRGSDLLEDLQRPLDAQFLFLHDNTVEVPSFDVLHKDLALVLVLVDAVILDDVLVVKARHKLSHRGIVRA